jgi:anti-sigma factor RsiW
VKDHSHQDYPPLDCPACAEQLQAYVDGDLPRDLSLRVFLHVRACPGCAGKLAQWQELVHVLTQFPRLEPPEDFDRRILAAVPYAAYREMAPLRRVRVPAYLEESFLPAFVRAAGVRLGGLVVAAGCGAAVGLHQLPPAALLGVGLGLAPEALVRLQDLGRRVTLGLRRSEGRS